MNNKIILILVGAALAVSGTIFGATTIPFQFTAGQTARAADVNANFNALATGVNGVDSRVTALEHPSTNALSALKVTRVSNHNIVSSGAIANSNYGQAILVAACPANSKVIGGGCSVLNPTTGAASATVNFVKSSYPDTDASWTCNIEQVSNPVSNTTPPPSEYTVYALCLASTPTSALTAEDSP